MALEGALVALLEDGIVDQYAGFSTAEESNAFYKKNVAARGDAKLLRQLEGGCSSS